MLLRRELGKDGILSMDKRTRYKLTLIAAIYLAGVNLLAIFRNLETVAVSCIAGLMTILTVYIWAQTKRPSKDSDQ